MIILFLSFIHFSYSSVSHQLWTQALHQYTVQSASQTLVDYSLIKKSPQALYLYLNQLEAIEKSNFEKYSTQEQLAFWINAYNAYTLQLVAKNYPIKSIREINSGLFSSGPWKVEFISLLGEKLTLDQIEHGIIRKKFNEPRIHFALNCASISCPNLQPRAFVSEKLDQQLNQAAYDFLKDPQKNEFKDKKIYLSKIFDWYGDDFKKLHGSYLQFIEKTLGIKISHLSIEFKDYNWNLNQK